MVAKSHAGAQALLCVFVLQAHSIIVIILVEGVDIVKNSSLIFQDELGCFAPCHFPCTPPRFKGDHIYDTNMIKVDIVGAIQIPCMMKDSYITGKHCANNVQA